MLPRQGKLQPGPAAPARRRQRDGGAGEQDRARADHRRGRHPCLRGAVVRHQDRCHPRPAQRDLVQGDARRHLLRPVLGAVRQGSRLHADRGPGRERAGLRRLGRGRQEEIRARQTAPTNVAAADAATHCRRHGAGGGNDTIEGTDHGYDSGTPRHAARPRRMRTRPRPSDRLAALRLFDQPQGHRHDVPGVRADRRARSAASCRSACGWS